MLPPAEQVTSGQYELGVIQGPILTGWKLRLFATSINWINLDLLRSKIARDGNIPQVLLETSYPEEPTFFPIHSHPSNTRDKDDEDDSDSDTIPLSQDNILSRIKSVLEVLPEERTTSMLVLPSVRSYHEAYKSKKTDPVRVLDFILKKLDGLDKQRYPMQWMRDYHKQNVLNQAEESKLRWQNNKPISIFDGVPFAVKDSIDALPYKTYAGTTFIGDHRKVDQDDPAVEALRSLGAILVGKTTMHEIGIGTTGINAKVGTAKNPHDPEFMTGGSSSGSAAIVASGLLPFALGTDGGGSIRIPAAFCGVFGLKTQYGRYSRRGFGLEYSVGVKGPICSNAEDLALVYAACANYGPDADKAAPLRMCKDSHSSHLKWSIGFYRDWFNHASDEVVAKCKHVLDLLSNLGMTIKTISIPELEQQRVAHSCTITSEMLTEQSQYLNDPLLRYEYNQDVQVMIWGAGLFTAKHYLQAQKIRTRSIIHYERIFADVDFIVSPTVPSPAQRLDPEMLECGELNIGRTTTINRFSFPANFSGYPAISIPVGTSYEGLPIGIQFMAKAWSEHQLIQLAAIIEKELRKDGMVMERPRVYFNPLEI